MTLAAGLRAALTSWWTFNSTMADAKGVNPLSANQVVAGYSAGKKGTQLNQGSRATTLLADPIAVSPSEGKLSLGAWLTWDGANTGLYIMGLVRALGTSTQEVFSLFNISGEFIVTGWADAGFTTYPLGSGGVRQTAYPITVRARDSAGQTATSNQVLRISETSDHPAGTYFVVVTYDEGDLCLYIDTVKYGPLAISAMYAGPITHFQVGAKGATTELSDCAIDEAFLFHKALSQAEIDFLYNMGAGISYAELQATP